VVGGFAAGVSPPQASATSHRAEHAAATPCASGHRRASTASQHSCIAVRAAHTTPSGVCKGCSKSFSPLYDLLLLLNDGNDITYDCKTADGESAACIKATFKAQPMAESPSPCPL